MAKWWKLIVRRKKLRFLCGISMNLFLYNHKFTFIQSCIWLQLSWKKTHLSQKKIDAFRHWTSQIFNSNKREIYTPNVNLSSKAFPSLCGNHEFLDFYTPTTSWFTVGGSHIYSLWKVCAASKKDFCSS